MEKAIDSFVKYQIEAEERFQRYEEERWKKEAGFEEKRRREDQEHEMRMIQMLAGQMFRYHSHFHPYPIHHHSPMVTIREVDKQLYYKLDCYQQMAYFNKKN